MSSLWNVVYNIYKNTFVRNRTTYSNYIIILWKWAFIGKCDVYDQYNYPLKSTIKGIIKQFQGNYSMQDQKEKHRKFKYNIIL